MTDTGIEAYDPNADRSQQLSQCSSPNRAKASKPRAAYSKRGYDDPRWQKLRLQVMERDGWRCVVCGDKENQLQVHHAGYKDGHMAWEYELGGLLTLCNSCHSDLHGEIMSIVTYLVWWAGKEQSRDVLYALLNATTERTAGKQGFVLLVAAIEREMNRLHDGWLKSLQQPLSDK